MNSDSNIWIVVLCGTKHGGAEKRLSYLFSNCYVDSRINLVCTYEFYQSLQMPSRLYYARVLTFRYLFSANLIKRISAYVKILAFIFSKASQKSACLHLHFAVDPSVLSFCCALISRVSSKVTYSIFIVNSASTFILRSKIRKLIWSISLANAKKLMFLSPSIYNQFYPGYLNENQSLRVSPCSFSPDLEANDIVLKPLESRYYDLCFVARFHRFKGCFEFVETVYALSKIICVRAVMLGFGPEFSTLKNMRSAYGLDNLDILSDLPARNILADSKILVSLQHYENYPSQVIFEAAACLTYVVSTDVGDSRLFLMDEYSTLVDRSPDLISRQLIMLLQNINILERKAVAMRAFLRQNHRVSRFSSWYNTELLNA